MKNHPMTLQDETPSTAKKSAETSPFIVEFFMVQCLCFRGMAYCDEEGRWRNAYSNSQLLGNIYLME
jgi:hypothetical protein